jgi:hypothetical protein
MSSEMRLPSLLPLVLAISLLPLVLAILALLGVGVAVAPRRAASPARVISPVSLYVDAAHGHDYWPGTRARPLRTVTAAWNRIPAAQPLRRPYTIVLMPGRWSATQTPNYWELRFGTAAAPIVIRAAHSGTATLPAVNMFKTSWLTVEGVRFADQFDLFHCEQCRHIVLEHSRFDGSEALLDTVKFNQSTWIYLRGDVIHGASENPLQFVAVQHGAVTGSDIYGGGDWCAYFKGGSADLVIEADRVHDCVTGGLLAGQGTGLQFMVAPFDHYEADGVVMAENWIWRIDGAGLGVNGGADVALLDNRLWDTGRASHTVEVDYGLRTCDGQPGDPGRGLCARYLKRGAWGTTRVDNGSNQVRIPDRNVVVAGNVIANPRRQGDELIDLPGPFGGRWQAGSGLGTVRTDTGLQIYGNLFAVGRSLPSGIAGCRALGCRSFRVRNTVTGPSDPFAHPARGDLRLRRGWPAVPVGAPTVLTANP